MFVALEKTRLAGVVEACEAAHLDLTEEELKEIRNVIDTADVVVGLRYNSSMEASLAA